MNSTSTEPATPSATPPAPTYAPIDPAMLAIIQDEKLAVFILSIALAVFIRNTFVSIQMLRRYQKNIYWLNLVQSLLGPVRLLAFLFAYLGFDCNCTFISLFTNYPHELSMDCISIILMIKAYAGTNRNIFIPIFGAVCIAGSIAVHTMHVVNTYGKYIKSPFGACGNYPNFYIVLGWFADLWIMNMFLTICFCVVIYRHSKFNKSRLFTSFLSDGMIYFFLITISNIVTPLLILFGVLGSNSSTLFDIDWAIQSYLVTQQLVHSAEARDAIAGSQPQQYTLNASRSGGYQSSRPYSMPKHSKSNHGDVYDGEEDNGGIMMQQKIEYKVESIDESVDDNIIRYNNDKQALTSAQLPPGRTRRD